MKRAHWIGLVPGLVLATGILASTAVAVLTSESGWFVMDGPAVMAFAVVGASALVNRSRGDSQGDLRVALILGAGLLLAGAILALRDPSRVVMMMPVLGAGAAASVVVSHGRRSER